MLDIFDQLRERNLCTCRDDFETRWLGVARRYLIVYGAPSLPASLRLYVRLLETGPQQADLSATVWARMMAQLEMPRQPRINKKLTAPEQEQPNGGLSPL